MSRLSSTLTKHRKDNYSLDIKGAPKHPLLQTPFAKRKDNEDRLFMRLRTQVTHNSSMQASDKDIGMKQRRRLSLSTRGPIQPKRTNSTTRWASSRTCPERS